VTRESELSALAGRFPRWEAWRGMSGLWHARLRDTTDQPVTGESVTDLADQIERAERLQQAERPAEHLARIKREHALWSVRHVSEGHGWTAHRSGYPRIWAGTLPDLEQQLAASQPADDSDGDLA
jgi:hypothetical protein